MKILAIIALFFLFRMFFRNFFLIKKKTPTPHREKKNNEIIDVEYEELE